MEGKKFSIGEKPHFGDKPRIGNKPRIQAGNIHVYFRGNCRFNIFYDDNDRIEFLIRCNNTAVKHDTKILAFVLMDNHVHLQIETNSVTNFVRDLLKGYVQWYNRKNGLSDKLFKSPFSSACKYSNDWITNSILYILNNPIKARICEHPSEYLWSSYHLYFGKRHQLQKYINIDIDLINRINKIFQGKNTLDDAIINFKADINELRDKNDGVWTRTTDALVIKHLNLILGKRNIYQINSDEMIKIIIALRNETGATYRQIASVTHQSYDYVRKTTKNDKTL